MWAIALPDMCRPISSNHGELRCTKYNAHTSCLHISPVCMFRERIINSSFCHLYATLMYLSANRIRWKANGIYTMFVRERYIKHKRDRS